MALYRLGSSSAPVVPSGKTEFDILKASHKFLREGDEAQDLSWDEKLAKKYYDQLYREFAVCDLKHYKSGNFALRWRTESEVISGAGETTCGNTRCTLHTLYDANERHRKSLKTVELPFSYVENGESKFALVKVVLCDKCLRKLMWKRTKEKEAEANSSKRDEQEANAEDDIKNAEDARAMSQRLSARKRRDDSSDRHDTRLVDDQDRTGRKRRRRYLRSPSPFHANGKGSSHQPRRD